MYCMFVVILLCNDIRSCKFYQFASDGSIFRCTEEEFEKRTVGFKVSWFSDKNNLSAYRHIVQSHNRVKWASVFWADSRVCLNADMLFLSFWRPEVRSETKFKHFYFACSVTCGRDALEGPCRLIRTELKLDVFDALHVHARVCVCVKLFPAESCYLQA